MQLTLGNLTLNTSIIHNRQPGKARGNGRAKATARANAKQDAEEEAKARATAKARERARGKGKGKQGHPPPKAVTSVEVWTTTPDRAHGKLVYPYHYQTNSLLPNKYACPYFLTQIHFSS